MEKSNYLVRSLETGEYVEWFKKKHYAKRIPSVSYCYGLYKDKFLIGVCSYGRPVAHTLVKYAFQGSYQDIFLELNRLVVDDNLEKNVLSYFVSSTLKLLPSPSVVVSYADTSLGHHGYIYQACNFIYTGLSAKRNDYKVKGLEHLHSASIMDMAGRGVSKGKVNALKDLYGDNLYLAERPRKHRYFYFIGTRKEKREISKKLIYKIESYPKGTNRRYDSSDSISRQGILF
tara:strand:- start:2986 stop:3678 length:693 start_codon:yes stop_codon:yes gene_type:complete